jgi:hypothetical protein
MLDAGAAAAASDSAEQLCLQAAGREQTEPLSGGGAADAAEEGKSSIRYLADPQIQGAQQNSCLY